jgi:N-terminal acetyltransferase B complex non-catalytic subunit
MININALKFEYLLCISKAPLPTKDSLEAFFSDSLRMYKIALGIDKECGDEACILAVMALVKLHHFSRDYVLDEKDPMNPSKTESASTITPQSYLIQAIALLELLRTNSPFNYSGALLLTLIAQMLNLTSLASIALGSLNIKEVQHDTVGHLFWSRISTSHPFPCSNKLPHGSHMISDYSTPSEGLGKAIAWYETASEKTSRFMQDSLDNVAFDQLFQFDEFRRKIDRSFSRAMYLLEQRKMARLTDGLQAFRDLPALPPTFGRMILDSRDFATIPSFEYQTTDTFDNFVVTKPKPSVSLLILYRTPDTDLINIEILDCPTYRQRHHSYSSIFTSSARAVPTSTTRCRCSISQR